MVANLSFDPLFMNLNGQWKKLLLSINEPSLEAIDSQEQLLATLANLLHDPRYTLRVAENFRPILIVICAQWLDQDGDEDSKLVALALLIDLHEELFPVFNTFLRKPQLCGGPLAHMSSSTSVSELHSRLLAYYRILVACPHVPAALQWSSENILQFISDPHPDTGVRWLAVRCYALQTRMSEAERDDLQLRVLGPAGEVDVPVEIGRSLAGQVQLGDGWLLPTSEVIRIRDARRAMLHESDFYDSALQESQCISIARVTHRVVDIHGFLFLKEPSLTTPPSKLVLTPSTINILRSLAVRLSLRLPILLSSPPSSGKSLLINHLASLLHPSIPSQVVTLHLSDTSLDARSLLGSYISSTCRPGAFEWQEGVIIRAMRLGHWLVLEDIDRASPDVLGTIIPLIDAFAAHKHIGAPASLDIPGRGRINAAHNFIIFATRSVATNSDGNLPPATFLGCSKFSCVNMPAPTKDDLTTILCGEFPRLGMRCIRALVRTWAVAKALGSAPGLRSIGIRELETWCRRINSLLPPTVGRRDEDVDMDLDEDISLESIYPSVALREEVYLEARDVFFGAGAFSESAKACISNLAQTFAERLGLSPERAQWVLEARSPEVSLDKDDNGQTIALRIGRTHLQASPHRSDILKNPQRPFAMHRPALLLTERISTCISLAEPVLLVGETGTGKTTIVSHLASLLNQKLVSLNLSHQTESSDLLGGFKPVDTRIPGGDLQRRFMDLFSRTFSRRKNSKFEDAVKKAVNESKWKRAVGLWKESMHLAVNKIKERLRESAVNTQPRSGTLSDSKEDAALNDDTPRKRRRVEGETDSVREAEWLAFKRDVEDFDVQHVQGKGKFAFGFIEGPLVKALRDGHWVLLDEINLASPETLECISSILQGPTASVVLAEGGSFAPVPRHPNFRLFACMNPAIDFGKKDLPPNIRSRFTEMHVPPPDADRETLLAIVQQYIGHCSLADKSALLDVAEFYTNVKKLVENRELADGSNHRPYFSMRTLARALTFTSDTVTMFGLRRALWEGCYMAFSMALDEQSAALVKSLMEKHLMMGVKNVRAVMAHIPALPSGYQADLFERIGPFLLECGHLGPDPAPEYILTPSVQSKLIDLARIVLTRRFPILIEGPTSSGKTSAVEYLARRTGHRFVRVNNHEHTDIQEYLGTYISDPETGKLKFQDGILVRALRNGDWIVLDELNLAPTDVLEALNRLLDDNRELIIAETQEVIKPHPHFMIFATQNPPGLYAGRKVLSRAFRNRFLEVHFDDVPQSELRTILSERCRIPDSYAQRIVSVFQELSRRRQTGRVFEAKHGFATLRDLFRWAGREASTTQELAQNGYMLLAERARRPDDKAIVKEVIETVMKEHIDADALYGSHGSISDIAMRLGVSPSESSDVIWTSAMRRLFILVACALKHNEPVLLVGETGSGKTSVCQLFAQAASKQLLTLNCHQSTETADLIGGQRPLRNRHSAQSKLINVAKDTLRTLPELATAVDQIQDADGMVSLLQKLLKLSTLPSDTMSSLLQLKQSLQKSTVLFQWHDGPLVHAMQSGDVFLLDEISLADDSVLERLNSVLEPARNIVLAERGGFDVEHAQISADPGFKLLATMNPGGDYGKKELSPALRNRFTEIWVPRVESKTDQRMIVHNSWRHKKLQNFTDHVLDFAEWYASAVGDASAVSVRDLITWVHFSNEVCDSNIDISVNVLFHHAAHMVFLDGLESSSHISNWQPNALKNLRELGRAQLERLVPLDEIQEQVFNGLFLHTSDAIRIGAFEMMKGPMKSNLSKFSLQAPTALDNLQRLVRACQISKPVLLEGSPGVGKTSLVSALGDVCGHRVCRINLSDQTDLMDLFGSDLPVEGGSAGEFAWKDAVFLRAMQDGDWVLLDEMNLAPQAVLEGLNAVLDHRGTVFIPELGRSFQKHPHFRVFAAQNPLHQGGGRKGLPKSFLDRFTKVYVQTLSSEDFLLICQNLFPTLSIDHLRTMILFNFRLHEETMVKRSFGGEGSPWEFNLRDVIRWATLLVDRERASKLFCEVFGLSCMPSCFNSLYASTTPHCVQFGSIVLNRGNQHAVGNSVELQCHLRALTAAGVCIQQGWLMILSGNAGAGKTQMVRYLAASLGQCLREFSISSSVDPTDLLGSFEQFNSDDNTGRFKWVDGPLVEAVKNGYWLLLDNANLCSPSVLDRLNSLCEIDGLLVLTERGHIGGKVEVLKPHPQFRLILTMDPHNGELSRAMRNRAIEIHLTATQTILQDRLRICDTIRVPSLLGLGHIAVDEIVTQFELLRRGHVQIQQPDLTFVPDVVHANMVYQDSVTSSLLDQNVFSHLQWSGDPGANTYARMLFSFRRLAPSRVYFTQRLFRALENQHSHRECPFIPSRLFDKSVHRHIYSFRCAIGKIFSQMWGVSPSFLMDEPFDLLTNPKLFGKGAEGNNSLTTWQSILSRAIELFVRIRFLDRTKAVDDSSEQSIFNKSRLYSQGYNGNDSLAPGASSIFPLYASSFEFAYGVLEALNPDYCGEQSTLLDLAKRLIDYAEHMRRCSDGLHFDFTSMRVVSLWFHDAIATNATLLASPVAAHAQLLAKEVSITSGHGMQEIWRSLLVPELESSIHLTINHLDRLAVNLDFRLPSYSSLRSDAFSAMALLALNTSVSDRERESLFALCNDLKQRLVSYGIRPNKEDITPRYPAHLAAAELNAISAVMGTGDKHVSRSGDLLFKLASQTTSVSLARFIQIQHFLWNLDLRKAQISGQLASMASMVREWMSAFNKINASGTSPDVSCEHAILYKPVLLREVVRLCRHDQALETLELHEKALQLQRKIVIDRCQQGPINRMKQVLRIWRGVLLMVAECFQETYPPGTIPTLQQAASEFDPSKSCKYLVELLSNSTNTHLSRIVQDRLTPCTHTLDLRHSDSPEWSRSMGKAWVALGFVFLELYIPNIPLDPVAAQKCASDFWKCCEVEITAQVAIHASAEVMLTGNESNPLISALHHQLDEARVKMGNSANHFSSRCVDVGTLQTLFDEITQFLDQVVKSGRLDALVGDLEAGVENSQARALVIQATISNFISRVEAGYSQLMDIIRPISFALTLLNFGLSFFSQAFYSRAANSQITSVLHNLVSFPTVAMVTSTEFNNLVEALSTPQLLVHLIASAYEIGLLGLQPTSIKRLNDINEKLAMLWLDDRGQEKRELEELYSLYRPSHLDHNMQSDIEIEEQDFYKMFPTFDKTEPKHDQDVRAASLKPKHPSKGPRLTPSDFGRISRLNLWIMDTPHSRVMDELRNEYHEFRISHVHDTLDSHFSWLSQSLDAETLPYQALLVSNATAELNGQRPMKRGVYNFYHDPNIPELKKAVSVIRAIQKRLLKLLNEWPEQMVLQHLMVRCEDLLKLHVHSPIAKVLSGLEQLLLQTEDWEIYSNQENTLKAQQLMLSGLIVEWRRLELAYWAQLLESEARAFSDGVAEWWFRLYELTIRGTIAAAAEGSTAVDAYLMEMIPLVEEFMTGSPLGQYTTRMRFLKTFGHYAAALSAVEDTSESEALARASRILQNLHGFHNQFAPSLSQSLTDRRTALEKEISGYIKLASWRDINVHALKQAARETHRQLYKCVRRFRELLREPITPFFSYNVPEPILDASHHLEEGIAAVQSLDSASLPTFSSGMQLEHIQPHLFDLPRTFSKFKDLLKSHGQAMISVVSFAFVGDLAGHIVDRVTALSTETNVAGTDMHLHKTLTMRKRKAWIDLLQELKRAGLSSRLKPETLKHQQNKAWLMDRLPLAPLGNSPILGIMLKSEVYLNRTLHLMPELRRSLASHHNDLPTRELQRAITFVESGFSLALNSRAGFAKDYTHFNNLHRVLQRLRTLCTSRGTVIATRNLFPWLSLCSRLSDALEDISRGCVCYAVLDDTAPLLPEIVDAISAHSTMIGQCRQSLSTLFDNLHTIQRALMTLEECDIFDKARVDISSTSAALKNWVLREPRIQYLCDPIFAWLTKSISEINDAVVEEPRHSDTRQESVIDRLLIIVQGLPSPRVQPQLFDEQPPDNYISESEHASNIISRVFALEAVARVTASFVDELVVLAPPKRSAMIQNILPFMDTYLKLVHNYLLVKAQLAKSLFKLSFILCCIVLSLATKGFCKPSPMDEKSAKGGEGSAEVSEGTGLGHGTGAENVSNQIEDKGQVEGLQGEESTEGHAEDDTADDNGIEMDDNFEGHTQDVDGDRDDNSDDGSQSDIEDQVGKANDTETDTVNEKFWGNESVAGDSSEERPTQAGSAEKTRDSETLAKEKQEKSTSPKDEQQVDGETQELPHENQESPDERPDEQPVDAGKRTDSSLSEANVLDLPDDLNLDTTEDGKNDTPFNDDLMDEDVSEDGAEFTPEESQDTSVLPQGEPRMDKDDDGDRDELPQPDRELPEEGTHMPIVGQPDISAGNEGHMGDQAAQSIPESSLDESLQDTEKGACHSVGPTTGRDEHKEDQTTPQGYDLTSAADPVREGHKDQIPDTRVDAMSIAEPISLPNPLRNLGDTLKEIWRRRDQIGDAAEQQRSPLSKLDPSAEPSQVDYLQEDQEDDHDFQALGPARDDHAAKLNELQISEDSSIIPNEPDHLDVHERNMESRIIHSLPEIAHMEVEANELSGPKGVTEITGDIQFQPESLYAGTSPHTGDDEAVMAVDIGVSSIEEERKAELSVEVALKQWQESGHSMTRSAEMWRRYDTLTQSLSFALCEQLRLILEPTLATRLRGDYRTGKRLNMKKIIPYIASEYTKDKIWLRRTRPSQREYQILIALDDSRSMAESRSVHLAYQTLALVSKALNRLESGEVAIVRFGENVELVHGFDEGIVDDQAGEKIMRQFRFAQQKTDVLGLVEASCRLLMQARERKAMGRTSVEATDLWQLEIIISDGICQDHDKLRVALRKAMEQRIMIVFVVVDSLHAHHGPSSIKAHHPQNSILSMNQVAYKDVGGGRIELQMVPYLDSFPFPYYVVLRNVDTLPDVLSGTLKQFLERISEA